MHEFPQIHLYAYVEHGCRRRCRCRRFSASTILSIPQIHDRFRLVSIIETKRTIYSTFGELHFIRLFVCVWTIAYVCVVNRCLSLQPHIDTETHTCIQICRLLHSTVLYTRIHTTQSKKWRQFLCKNSSHTCT